MRKTETQKGKINLCIIMHAHTHTSLHMQVQKFVILKNDLSIPGGELGERVRRWRKERRERERERKKLIKRKKESERLLLFLYRPNSKVEAFLCNVKVFTSNR